MKLLMTRTIRRLNLLPLTWPLALAVACGTSGSSQTPQGEDSLAGRWVSDCVPMNDQQGFALDFDIQPRTWALDYVVHGDKACGGKFMTVRIEGPYEVGATAATVPGAREARFGFTKKTVTAHTPEAVGFLSSAAGCGLQGLVQGTPFDISQTGCATLGQRPVAACSADYDLVKRDGERLQFGARPADNDMCSPEKRPQALSPLTVKKSS
jgi:hypothetical protein